jgi:hypothetical protein
MPGWNEIYPEKRVVTLILDPFEAEELLDQALSEGRRIGERTVMGMPMIAFGDTLQGGPAEVEPDPEPNDLEAWNRLGRRQVCKPADGDGQEKDVASDAVSTTDRDAQENPREPGDNTIAILPVVRRERLPEPAPETKCEQPSKSRSDRRSILDEKPAAAAEPATVRPQKRFNKAKGKWERPGAISDGDRALIDQAIAQGRVTKCPDFKHSVEPGELLPGEGWRRGKKKQK